jgi:hypothetical protein
VTGPYEPDKGFRFDAGKLLLDPYGKGGLCTRLTTRDFTKKITKLRTALFIWPRIQRVSLERLLLSMAIIVRPR